MNMSAGPKQKGTTAAQVACERQTHFRWSLLLLSSENSYFSEGEKRRREMRLLFAGYSTSFTSTELSL